MLDRRAGGGFARRAAVLATALIALVAAGCGAGAGGGDVGAVTLVVTRDFGRVPLPGSGRTVDAPGGETALRALRRAFPVRTGGGGGRVQSIAGVGGGRRGDRGGEWSFWVNGVDSRRGAASTGLHRGDVIWWDHGDRGVASRPPAVVGSFPEPFRHGIDGKRLPVRLECAPESASACQAASRRLGEIGVIPGRAVLNTRGGEELLRVLVGPWPALRSDFAARLLEQGPRASGVYAVPSRDGRTLRLLDPRGRATRTLGPGAGLIAATATEALPPTWIVTGTDAAGIERAARSLTGEVLGRRYAVALVDDQPIALPMPGRR